MKNNKQLPNMLLKDRDQESRSANPEAATLNQYKNKMATLALELIKLSPYDNYDDPEMPSHIIRGRE